MPSGARLNEEAFMSPPRSSRFLSEDELLRDCRWDVFRGSGPGGQKRNKTSNAVRLTHLPSAIHVTATEARSLAENKLHAVRRLRLKMVADLREPIDVTHFSPPDWFLEIRHNKRIGVSHRHPWYAPAGGLVLDLLEVMHGNPAAVAVMLSVTTTVVIRLLENVPVLWAAANRIRNVCGMKALTPRG